jgi:hypothetical protein
MTGTPLGRDLAVKGRSRLCRCAKRRLEGESRPARTRTEAGRSIRTLTAAARPAPMERAPRIPIPPGQRPITPPAPRPMPGIPPITRRSRCRITRHPAATDARRRPVLSSARLLVWPPVRLLPAQRPRPPLPTRHCRPDAPIDPFDTNTTAGVCGSLLHMALTACITFRAHNSSGAGVDAGFVVHQ